MIRKIFCIRTVNILNRYLSFLIRKNIDLLLNMIKFILSMKCLVFIFISIMHLLLFEIKELYHVLFVKKIRRDIANINLLKNRERERESASKCFQTKEFKIDTRCFPCIFFILSISSFPGSSFSLNNKYLLV